MIEIKREVKIGVLIASALFIFVWGINYLRGTNIFSKHITFYAVYEQTVGLMETSSISVNGVKIGHVDKIFFHPDGSGNIIVKCIIEQKLDVPDNSTARLYGSGLTGAREIDIVLGDSPSHIQHRDTINSAIEPFIQDQITQQLLPLREKTEKVLLRTDSVLKGMNYVFKEDSRQNIIKSIEDLQKSMASIRSMSHTADTIFQNQSKEIASIINNVESISTNLKNNDEVITHILQNIESISDSIASSNIVQTVNNANKSLESFNNIMDKIDQGKGSAGMLVNDDSLYINLSKSSKELELLLEDIRKNPGRYINVSLFK